MLNNNKEGTNKKNPKKPEVEEKKKQVGEKISEHKDKKVLQSKKPKAEGKNVKVAPAYKKPQLKFERVETEGKGKKAKIKKKFKGVVVSDKMDKTLVVAVSEIKIHSKYHKRYYRSKRYKVHSPENKYKLGDEVTFSPCRPYSKEKKWKVVKS